MTQRQCNVCYQSLLGCGCLIYAVYGILTWIFCLNFLPGGGQTWHIHTTIACAWLLQTNDPSQRLHKEHFMYNYDSGTSGTYINYREVTARFELEPGHYVIIPTTFKSDFPSKFMIRVFAEKDFELRWDLQMLLVHTG